MDNVSRAQRSAVMAKVKAKHTTPELIVRRTAHALGYRFRLHRSDLPGSPDLVFVSRRKVIFVNGCFWHGHNCPRGSRKPATNVQYWSAKIARNVRRDREVRAKLRSLKWRALLIWECELRDDRRLRMRLAAFLDD
ncbi:very short patch repair endonuclease [Reyranella sp. CPCC 100927]|uniref:very short patch repair endonuclease n=1 Tax=Reyranella sp. CPCC 100927 TaxID=2599616 RepID=UPI0011B85BE7|nr:very short patch repair endonuclease [Reyranella sp. CPCC 100927]TWT06134.1 DNA mismatch endonuclease Vsr [Reyranella sp. CPCC 100927]